MTTEASGTQQEHSGTVSRCLQRWWDYVRLSDFSLLVHGDNCSVFRHAIGHWNPVKVFKVPRPVPGVVGVNVNIACKHEAVGVCEHKR
jgi:hypothetical protein